MKRIVEVPPTQWICIANLPSENGEPGMLIYQDDDRKDRFRIEYTREDGSRSHKTIDFTKRK